MVCLTHGIDIRTDIHPIENQYAYSILITDTMFQYVLSNFYIDILFPGGLSYGIAHLGNYTYEM